MNGREARVLFEEIGNTKLGTGGFGSVYAAKLKPVDAVSNKRGRNVAVKLVPLTSSTVRELAFLDRFSGHRNILHYFGYYR